MILLLAILLLAYGLLTLRGAVRPGGHLLALGVLALVLWHPAPPTALAVAQPQPAPAQADQPAAPPAVPAALPASSARTCPLSGCPPGTVNLTDETIYPRLADMPDELALYTAGTVQEVADFFNVRPGDILGILRAETNDVGYRVAQSAVSSAGARGVAQVVPRTWNGWSNPHTASHLTDMQSIVAHGGLGFDWQSRNAWRTWEETGDASGLAGAHADPDQFADAVAAIGLHLYRYGLTRDRAAAEPGQFRSALADSIAIYNSGKPLSESASWTQSAANRKTVAQYVAGAIAVSDSTPAHLGELFNVQAAPPPPAPVSPPTRFASTPLLPMPAVFKGFGVAVDYQAGGRHTGIDVANPREGGQEPALYAVDAGTVVHVGPLYCDVANACRGGNAIVLDHGHNVYSIYSHNSSAAVSVGQQVAAGEPIGRQGNEGYSFGSHLHFEVHSGAPWSGNWQEPFQGGQFEDPAAWLPS